MIKIRVEGSKNEVDQVVECLQKRFIELNITGQYEMKRSKLRTYIDLIL